MLLPALIFAVIMGLVIFEVYDKAILSSIGAVLMIATGVIDFETAIHSIEFETIILLMSMMLLVEVSRESGIFNWLTVKMAKFSNGNPLLIFLLFSFTTAFLSAFLDNVTTIVLIVPVTIALVKGMGLDPKPYVLSEIIFSNIGGTLTLIGDPPNILIAGYSGLSFSAFITNLWMPVFATLILITGIIVATHWKQHFKPISTNLRKLFLTSILIRKITYKFFSEELDIKFMLKSIFAITITITSFLLQKQIGINVGVLAFSGALLLLVIAKKEVEFEHSIKNVEWSTLLFFCGLFVMVGAIEHVGLLEKISEFIIGVSSGSYVTLLLTVLWVAGFTSMILDNIPFVALMLPVIVSIQGQLDPGLNQSLLWWALSLGACFGGNGTIIGASANVIGVDLAKKDGVNISFLEFFKYGFPITMLSLVVSSFYLYFRVSL